MRGLDTRRVRAGALVGIAVLGSSLALRPAAAEQGSRAPARSEVLVYGGAENSPPYEYLDAAGQPQGFNVELVRALAATAGRGIDVRLGRWSEVVNRLARGQIDLASMGYAEDRAERYDFLAETWTARQSLLYPAGRAGGPTRLTDMAKETVAVEDGSLAHDLFRSLPDVSRPLLRPARTHVEAVKALLRGDATAVAGNALVLRVALADLGTTDVVELPVKAASYHLVTSKGRGPELAWIAGALARLHESGEFSRLVERHLATPRPARSWRDYLGLLATGLGTALALVAGGVGWSVSLRRQVKARTQELVQFAREKERAEAEATSANRELAAKNDELERFAYTVSHDLKSPLITIQSFADLMARDLAADRLTDLRGDLERIDRAAKTMSRLLTDLLELSRIGRVLSPPQPVPLSLLAQEAADHVKGRLQEGSVEVAIAENLPVVNVDRQRLLEVLQNLLDNAAKFMGGAARPRVEVGVRRDGDTTVYYVRDNGMGIERKHLERVFGLFDKLEPASDGTGIGLAVVRRIVEAHRGRAWAESEGRGLGSTFCFTLHEG